MQVQREANREAAANEAAATAHKVFEQGGVGGDLPIVPVASEALSSGIPMLDLLIEAGFASSKGEARRLIKGGGVRINDDKISDEACTVSADHMNGDSIKISASKKKHALVKIA